MDDEIPEIWKDVKRSKNKTITSSHPITNQLPTVDGFIQALGKIGNSIAIQFVERKTEAKQQQEQQQQQQEQQQQQQQQEQQQQQHKNMEAKPT